MPKQKPLNPEDYAEEKHPFDDAMRQLLQAKPQPKKGAKDKLKKAKSKK